MARDVNITVWPTTFSPASISVTIDRPLFKGPKPLDGREQVVASSAGGWRISYDNVPVYGSVYNAFRVLWVSMAAQGNPAYVEVDLLSAPAPTLSIFSDSTTFSDGTSFASSTWDCTLAASASKGATSISVTNSVTRPRAAGDWFELSGRAHLIQSISGTTWMIWPALRADYTSGDVLEIDDPRVLAYLTPDSAARTLKIDARQVSFVSFDLIEAGW